MNHRMPTLKFFRSVILILSLVLSTGAMAASFDCSGHLNEVEQVICEDEELSSLDRGLAGVYENYTPTGYEIAPVPELMASWREMRDGCGTNKTCINLVYQSWIFSLRQNEIVEQLAPPDSRLGGRICLFQASQHDLSGPQVYSCYTSIHDLDAPAANACHVGDHVYRLVQDEEWFLERWDTVVEFLLGERPAETTNVDSVEASFGRDHYFTGCHLHSCISAYADTPDGVFFGSPDFYFWFGPEEWEPIVYPSSTMFIVGRDGHEYPDVQFCRYLD